MTDADKTLTEQGTTRPFLIVSGADVTGKKPPTNYLETIIHCIKGCIGTGVFAMGSAFMNSGILLGPLLMTALALISLHCQHLVIRACVKITEKEPVKVLPSFAETVQYTFEDSSSKWLQQKSKSFGIVTDIFLTLAEYGFCVVYFVFISTHLGEVTAAYGWDPDYRIILAIILIPMWLSTFLGNLKLMTPMSLIANLMQWIGIFLILYYATKDLPPISERQLISNVNRLPLFFGTVLFSTCGVPLIIPLRMEMKHPESFTSAFGVLNVSTTVIILVYFFVGFFAYWKWGDQVEGSVFLNMPNEEPLSQAAKILISLGILMTYALHMYVPFQTLYPRFYKRWGPFKHPAVVMDTYKSVAVIVTYALANITSNIAAMISLVGALCGTMLSMLLPPLLQLVMLYGKLTNYIIIKNTIIMIIAISGAITGTIISVMDIVNEYIKEHKE